MRRKCHTCLCRTCLNVCKCEGCTGKKESCERYSGFRQLSIFEQEIKQHMRILVACEESQRVCIEFRELGHEAYSCDIEPCSGGHPEWHIQADVLPLLNGDCSFRTVDGMEHRIDGKWDMIIAFPPCTYMTNAGAVRMRVKGEIVQERYKKAMEAKAFFMQIMNANCEKIAIENPTPMKLIELPPYTQAVQPYQFGHPYSKRTCLWLKGLPKLEPTEILKYHEPYVNGGCKDAHGNYRRFQGRKERDSKTRAKTFPGIANAMAEQWGKVDEPTEPQYQSVPRHSWQHYGISKERYRQLTEYIQSGRYTSVAHQAAHTANETIAEYILLSVTQNKSYDALRVKWELKEMERIPYCRTDFYGIRRYAIHLFDLEMRRIGK